MAALGFTEHAPDQLVEQADRPVGQGWR
jgi:hypothetical protein